MPGKTICDLENIEVRMGEHILLNKFNLKIDEPTILSVISEDESASTLLQIIAGLINADKGKVKYPSWNVYGKTDLAQWVQYVPDDIVCYRDMKVKQFLHGIALSESDREMEKQGLKLCRFFGIDPKEKLLDLTFEQNRLVAMIQAIVMKPRLLLLDRPYDLISKKQYADLLRMLVKLRNVGMSIIIAADSYRDIIMPSDRYLFIKEGKIVANYGRKELPRPAKVVTMDGGSLSSMKNSLMTVLYQTPLRSCFLYREQNAEDLMARLYKSGCKNFSVDALTIEEEVFKNYERWKL